MVQGRVGAEVCNGLALRMRVSNQIKGRAIPEAEGRDYFQWWGRVKDNLDNNVLGLEPDSTKGRWAETGSHLLPRKLFVAVAVGDGHQTNFIKRKLTTIKRNFCSEFQEAQGKLPHQHRPHSQLLWGRAADFTKCHWLGLCFHLATLSLSLLNLQTATVCCFPGHWAAPSTPSPSSF